jgi:glutamine amidotransferase
MKVLVVDYGMGNLASVGRALEECGASVVTSDDPGEIERAEAVVIPGVGAFADGMKNLNARHLSDSIRRVAGEARVPVLGICLGMHLLADRGFEGGEIEGLGLIGGEVRRLEAQPGERLPHVGWNEVQVEDRGGLLDEIESGTDFYFVHSYHLAPADEGDVAARTPYCGGFVSVVRRHNVWGTQFHPEKSSRPGFRVLANFLKQGARG